MTETILCRYAVSILISPVYLLAESGSDGQRTQSQQEAPHAWGASLRFLTGAATGLAAHPSQHFAKGREMRSVGEKRKSLKSVNPLNEHGIGPFSLNGEIVGARG